MPTAPPVASRTERAAEDRAQDGAADKSTRMKSTGSICRVPPSTCGPARGSGSGSPSMTAIMRSTAGGDAAVEVALAKARHDDLADDPVRGGVVERALQAVAHLDAHRPVVLGDDEHNPVIDVLASDFPLFRDAQGVLLDRLGLPWSAASARRSGALARLERLQHLLERGDLLRLQRAGKVGDASFQRRHGDLRPRRKGEREVSVIRFDTSVSGRNRLSGLSRSRARFRP